MERSEARGQPEREPEHQRAQRERQELRTPLLHEVLEIRGALYRFGAAARRRQAPVRDALCK